MEKINYSNVDEKELTKITFDLGILSCGIEVRSAIASTFFSRMKIKKSVIFEFNNTKMNKQQLRHHEIIKKELKDKEFIDICKDDPRLFITTVKNNIFTKLKSGEKVNILIDYSSMPRIWYCGLLHYFYDKKYNNINLFMIYRVTKTVQGKTFVNVSNLKTNNFQFGVTEPDKAKLVFLGLGYDHLAADALIQKLECEPILFYTKPALINGIEEEVFKRNNRLLSSYQFFHLPIHDIEKSIENLNQQYNIKKDEYSILIAPLGPKPMILISSLFSIINEAVHEIAVTSEFNNKIIYRDNPQAKGCIYKITFI